MPVYCAAYGCVNRRSIDTRREGITFHRFPRAGDQRREWEVALRRKGFAASNESMLCSKHFKPEHFDRTGQTVRIRLGVVPSIFKFPAHSLLTSTASTAPTTETSGPAEENLPLDLSQEAPVEPPPLPQFKPVDHTYALSSCPVALKEAFIKARDNVVRLETEKRNTKKRETRLKSSLQDVLMELRENNLMTEELSQRLGLYADLPLHLFEKKANEYNQEQREFAITLHLHGPKAYRYLRSTLQLPLPHPRSLQRWWSSLDDKPGLNTMMLNMLGRRCELEPDRHCHVTLVLDAMLVKKHMQYNPQTEHTSGNVDLDDGCDETDPATEALVLTVVGLQAHWKAPIGYFFTSTLTPDTQKELVVHALEALHERSIKVVSITMDGNATNLGMCKLLGADLKGNPDEPLKTSLPHPSSGDEVFVILNACEMLTQDA